MRQPPGEPDTTGSRYRRYREPRTRTEIVCTQPSVVRMSTSALAWVSGSSMPLTRPCSYHSVRKGVISSTCSGREELGPAGRSDDVGREVDVVDLSREGTHHRVQRPLARDVDADAAPRRVVQRGFGRQVDGVPARRPQVLDRRRGDERRTHDVGVEDRTPVVGGRVGELTERAHPGRVHEHVQAAERVDGVGDHRTTARLVAHVARERDRPAPPTPRPWRRACRGCGPRRRRTRPPRRARAPWPGRSPPTLRPPALAGPPDVPSRRTLTPATRVRSLPSREGEFMLRCVVTGQQPDGKSVFVFDGERPSLDLALMPADTEFLRLWGADSTPSLPTDGIAARPADVLPARGRVPLRVLHALAPVVAPGPDRRPGRRPRPDGGGAARDGEVDGARPPGDAHDRHRRPRHRAVGRGVARARRRRRGAPEGGRLRDPERHPPRLAQPHRRAHPDVRRAHRRRTRA